MHVAVAANVPIGGSSRPPVLLIHGSANSAEVWIYWQQKLAELGWASYALDLRGHGASAPMDLSRTSMADYIADVESLVSQLGRPSVIAGWSMGAVIAMMVAARGRAVACVALEPSPLARTFNPDAELREGEFGGEEYGITSMDPGQQPAMPDLDREEREIALASLCRESRYARDERRRAGIAIESMPCPLLMVNGPDRRLEAPDRWKDFWLKADFLNPDEGSHWGLVLNRRLLQALVPQVTEWLERKIKDNENRIPLIQKVDCVQIPVPDLDAGLAFYRDRLGHGLIWRTGRSAGLRLPETDAEIVIQTERPGLEVNLTVASSDEAASAFTRAGGSVIVEPFDIPIGRCAVVADPWGNRLVLLDTSKGLRVTDSRGYVLPPT